MTSTASGKKIDQRLDDLMSRAGEALSETRCFDCEKLATQALDLALSVSDFERMASVLLPLQEARRQKRLAALDTGAVITLDDVQSRDELRLEPGCWLVAPPLVGADGRNLRQYADAEHVPVLVIVREPVTLDKRWPIVMIGPVTVRTKISIPKKVTPAWMLSASETLGDEAIAQLDPELAPATRVAKLHQRLQTLPDHEKLHQALHEACLEAAQCRDESGS